MKSARFTGREDSIWGYVSPYVAVCCPRCNAFAKVFPERNQNGSLTHRAKLSCSHCGLSKTESERRWIGPVRLRSTRQRCFACGGGKLRLPPKRPLAGAPQKLKRVVRCQGCGAENVVKIEPVAIAIGRPFDPFFGARLFLTANVRGHDFWAFNEAHIDLLRSYLAADLRGKPPMRQSATEKLPRWMVVAGTRDAALRALDDFGRRLALYGTVRENSNVP